MVLALLVLLVGLSAVSFRQPRQTAEVRGAAQLLASELAMAREMARARQEPVGLALPSGGGATAHAAGYYLARGSDQPEVFRSVQLEREELESLLYFGSWPVNPAELIDSAASPRIGRVTGGPTGGEHPVDLDAWWNRPDPILVFTPGGQVLSNDLPRFDGAYHLVVCAALSYSGAAAPTGTPTVLVAPPYTQVERIRDPYTVSVTTDGRVTVQAGLRAATGVTVDPLLTSSEGAPPPGLVPHPGLAPQIEQVGALPNNPADLLPVNVDFLVAPDNHLTLSVEATDSDSAEKLYCFWEASRISSSAPGAGFFSSPGRGAMVFDSSAQRWSCEWAWRPPPGAQRGDQYRLVATVYDKQGQSTTAGGAAQVIDVELSEGGKILFRWDGHIWSIRPDGTHLKNLTDSDQAHTNSAPDMSSDGSLVVFYSDRNPQGWQDLYLMNIDGSDVRRLTTTPEPESQPRFAPDNTWIAYSIPKTLKVLDLETRTETVIWSGDYIEDPAVSPDGEWIAFAGRETPGDPPVIWAVRPDGSEPHALFPSTLKQDDFVFNPNYPTDPTIVYHQYMGPGQEEMRTAQIPDLAAATASTPPATTVVVPMGPVSPSQADFSPDGDRIVFYDQIGGGLYIVNRDGTDLKRLTDLPGQQLFPRWSR